MTQTCRPAKCIEAIRVSLLDQCTYLPICGLLNGYAMGCVIDPDWNPEIEEGDESVVKDACGNICLQDLRCDQVKRWNLEFKISRPDKEFLALIGGDNLIVDEGVSVGVQHLSSHCSPWLFVELFERTDDCTGGAPVYYRHVFPAARLMWSGNEKEGIFRILQIEGKTKDTPVANIGTGPYGDIPAYAIAAPAGSRSDYLWFEDTTVPVVQCGSIEVPCPSEITFTDAGPSNCTSFVIVGEGLDGIDHIQTNFGDYYNPTGPNAGLNPAWVTINSWTDVVLNITDYTQGNFSVTSVTMWDVGDVTQYGPFVLPPNPSGCCADPTFETVTLGENCDEVTITGTNFDVLKELYLNLPNVPVTYGNYQNPWSPDPNPVGSTIVTWTDTLIVINDPTFANNTDALAEVFGLMWGICGEVGPTVYDHVDCTPPCVDPTEPFWTSWGPPDGGQYGFGFSPSIPFSLAEVAPATISMVQYLVSANEDCSGPNIAGCQAFFDPYECDPAILAADLVGSPTGTSYWVRVRITDINNVTVTTPCCAAREIIIYTDPPVPSAFFTPACNTTELNGTGFDEVNHVQIQTSIGNFSYFDPAGPDAGLNPGFVTVNSWTDTVISVTHTNLAANVTGIHLWGLGNVPDFGLFDFPDFVVVDC